MECLKMDEVEKLFQVVMDKFKVKIAEDESLRTELGGVTKTVNIDVHDLDGLSFTLDKGEIKDFKVGKLDEADVMISASKEDFIALFNGELKPMKAWATKRLTFEASIEDIMRLRKLF